ncbi:MAG: NnrU family protein [Alphaproteobacteria bacterium]
MDPALIALTFATLAFVGGHFLLSSAPVRGPLTGMMGEGPFRGVYSVLMIAALYWMIAALYWMIAAYIDAPYIPLWDAGILGPPIILICMYFAIVFFVCSVTTRNPTPAGMDNLHYENAPGKGIYAVVRHPMLAAFALWSLAHLFVRGDVAGAFFFGGMLVLSALGMVHIYARRDANADDAWRSFRAGTSRTPFRAILEGRRTLVMHDVGWWRVALGTVLYFAVLYVHETVFGMHLFPA